MELAGRVDCLRLLKEFEDGSVVVLVNLKWIQHSGDDTVVPCRVGSRPKNHGEVLLRTGPGIVVLGLGVNGMLRGLASEPHEDVVNLVLENLVEPIVVKPFDIVADELQATLDGVGFLLTAGVGFVGGCAQRTFDEHGAVAHPVAPV